MIHFALPMLLAAASTSLDATAEATSSTSLSIEPAAVAPYLVPAAQAKSGSPFSYTYIQIGYYSTDVDALDETADAVYGRASLGLFKFLYIFASYSAESIDDAQTSLGSVDVDNDATELGVGAFLNMTPKLDLVGEIAYVYDDISSDDVSNLDDSNDGWTAMAGARWMVLPWEGGGLELNGGFRWQDRQALTSEEEDGFWEAGARFHFLKLFSVGAGYQFSSDDERIGIDARLSF